MYDKAVKQTNGKQAVDAPASKGSSSHGVKRPRGGFNANKDARVRTWAMQELDCLQDAWQPDQAKAAQAEAEEATLRAYAAAGPSAVWESGGRAAAEKKAAVRGAGQPSKPAIATNSSSGKSSQAGGGSDLLGSILGGNFGTAKSDAAATERQPPAPAQARPTEAASLVDELRQREVRAAEAVRRMHAAAAMDVALPRSGARARLLPLLGPVVGDAKMAVALLRAGVLGAIRRTLQTTADTSVTSPSHAAQMRLTLFGMLRCLAPSVQPAHLRQSRGLGKLLMLIARSTSEPRAHRDAASRLLEAMLPREQEASAL